MLLRALISSLFLLVGSTAIAEDYIIPDDGIDYMKLYNSFENQGCKDRQRVNVDLLFVQEAQLDDMDNKSDDWVREVNRYYRDSKVLINLRKVGLIKRDFNNGTMIGKLEELKKSRDIAEARNEYRADYVMGITSKRGGGGAIGIGYISISPDWAFSVVRDTAGPITVAHELGHNMGLGHSVLQGSNGRPYKWGRGYGVRNKFATIMSYAHLYPAPRIKRFSNPRAKCAGLPCGIGVNKSNGSNSVRAINCVSRRVSQHR